LQTHDHLQLHEKVDGKKVDIYREHTMWDGTCDRTRYAVEEGVVTVPVETPDETKPNPKMGVGLVEWSSDSAFMLTRNDNMPTAVWVWETETLELKALLLHDDPVRSARWDGTSQRLAICTGNSKLFFWSVDSAACVDVPMDGFHVNELAWSAPAPDGGQVIILDDAVPAAARKKTFNHYAVVYLAATG
jgi:WD40 repeat protein